MSSCQRELQRHARIMCRCRVGRCRYQREVALEVVVEVQGEHAAVCVVGAEGDLDGAVAAGGLGGLVAQVAAQGVLVAV